MAGVFIGVPCGSHARYSAFWGSLQSIRKPDGSEVGLEIGPFIVNNQNFLGRRFLKSKCEWFFLANDDQIYQPDILDRLMAHGKDAIVGLCVSRRPPHTPLIYGLDSEGKMRAVNLQPTNTGLIPIDGSGGGSLLLHRSVFEKIAFPWWEVKPQPDGNHGGEDLAFCRKLIAHKIQLWCDTDVQVGHIMEFTLTPHLKDGVWQVSMERH